MSNSTIATELIKRCKRPQNREELAWAAGLFDGEGSFIFRINNSSTPYVIAQIGQTHPAVLFRFLMAVRSVGRVHGPYNRDVSKASTNRSPRYDYNANGFEDAQAVIAMLWFKLSLVKKQQATAALRRFLEKFHSERR